MGSHHQEHKVVSASAIFPGPHSATPYDGQAGQVQTGHQKSSAVEIIEGCVEDIVPSGPQIQNMSVELQKRQNDKMMYHRLSPKLNINRDVEENISKKRCPPEKSFVENSQNAFGREPHLRMILSRPLILKVVI